MINFAKFEVIGNVGAIQASGNVTHLKIASNFRRKNGEEWVDDTNWNRVTIFNERYRKTIAERLRVGDLIFAEGTMRDTSYEREGETVFTTDQIVEKFGILSSNARAD
ncbi:Single-stranded DNA-binding protein [Sphingobium herbicidovorans NBRC 16415]|uniref:Single-stranded DNA-binding protein n=1 Tax=Sphingobium herbicidovorans (strain ATCC 700291 / DSM 11019 / CCUG 56400 / KCTC 2939 / LMG 18315 / NBRC 16415 / MH) TaxID=1219045 RepID=A0A086P9B8_SPHHM|nr:single-stranded DNA-binding protein [Sphingobium herbicidovorans]KFG89986.1 Single-stranded DNA-binding protein [Sphingobium herbicidovorans NBRC 16415]